MERNSVFSIRSISRIKKCNTSKLTESQFTYAISRHAGSNFSLRKEAENSLKAEMAVMGPESCRWESDGRQWSSGRDLMKLLSADY